VSKRTTLAWLLGIALVALFVVVILVRYKTLEPQPPTVAGAHVQSSNTPAKVIELPPASVVVTNTVFTTFGPTKSYRPVGWSVGTRGHAEWFIPRTSGRLHSIEIAVEPNYVRRGREKTAANAEVFMAEDKDGFPGKILEGFSISADPPTVPAPTSALVLESAAQPALQAGSKYWVLARCPGPGTWSWRFNDQNLTEVSAYEKEPDKWTSAGNGYNGALSVTVTSAQ
jgi:hypothetical protein